MLILTLKSNRNTFFKIITTFKHKKLYKSITLIPKSFIVRYFNKITLSK